LAYLPIYRKSSSSPFSQIEDNDTRYYEGTGLGLSICKELVGLLGGEIGVVNNNNNIGSTFWFTFTAQIAESQQEPEPRNHKYTNHQNLHILLTEDKVVNQKVVS
jgi:two-component system, sensor histidine kinase